MQLRILFPWSPVLGTHAKENSAHVAEKRIEILMSIEVVEKKIHLMKYIFS